MGECNEYIEKVYLSPEVEKLIKSIQPTSLQDDLRQEMAIALLSINCEKISQIWASNGLLGFAIKIISNKNPACLYKKYYVGIIGIVFYHITWYFVYIIIILYNTLRIVVFYR
jgi:hypothetical protein